jgi:hypothetical protein
LKNVLNAPTPRKQPFKDTTNAGKAKIEIGGKNDTPNELKKAPIQKEQKAAIVNENIQQEQEEEEDLFFDAFQYPINGGCFCCGADRRSRKIF